MPTETPAPRSVRRALLPTTFALLAAGAWLQGVAGAQEPAPPATQPPGAPLPPIAAAADLPEVVARVNSHEITRRELLAQAHTMRLQAVQAGASDPAASEDFLKFMLDALINERLVYLDSEARGVGPTDSEIDERLQAVVAAYGSEEAFDKALAAQGLDRGYVRQQVAQTLSFDKIMDSEIVPGIELSEEAIAAYYERTREQLRLPATYKVRHVMKVVPEGAGDAARAAARAQLEDLRRQVLAGADLAALAREHSDDARTREQGGELPWIVLTGREGSFEPAVAALSKGELSGVVETEAGLHLIRLEDVRPARVKTLDEARGEIRNALGALEARNEIQRRVEKLKASAQIEVLM